MMKAEEFMKEFMSELDGDLFTKDNQPNDGPEITDAFIEDRLKGYEGLLQSGILDCVKA